MNRRTKRCYQRYWPVLIFISLVMLPGVAMASSPEWRPTYDLIMMWVNFLILAGVIYKYGREPFKKFLKGQKEDLSLKVDELESEKARVIGEINAAQVHTEENKQKLVEMKARLIAQGETRKQEIIDQARNQSAIMIEAARKKMENRIVQAKEKLKMELADLAFEQATQKLPQMITDADNQLFIDNYMQGMNRT